MTGEFWVDVPEPPLSAADLKALRDSILIVKGVHVTPCQVGSAVALTVDHSKGVETLVLSLTAAARLSQLLANAVDEEIASSTRI